jgi:hypothetical protein
VSTRRTGHLDRPTALGPSHPGRFLLVTPHWCPLPHRRDHRPTAARRGCGPAHCGPRGRGPGPFESADKASSGGPISRGAAPSCPDVGRPAWPTRGTGRTASALTTRAATTLSMSTPPSTNAWDATFGPRTTVRAVSSDDVAHSSIGGETRLIRSATAPPNSPPRRRMPARPPCGLGSLRAARVRRAVLPKGRMANGSAGRQVACAMLSGRCDGHDRGRALRWR